MIILEQFIFRSRIITLLHSEMSFSWSTRRQKTRWWGIVVLYLVFSFEDFSITNKECVVVTLKTLYIVFWWSEPYLLFLYSRTGFWFGLLVLNCSVLHSIKLVKVTVPGMIDGLQQSFHLSWKTPDEALWLGTKLANCHQVQDLLLFYL